MLLRLISLGIVFFAGAFTGHSQKVSEYKFTVLNSTVGLAGNVVISVTQDHKGYMWFATDNGLQRYDGKRFLTFRNKPGDLTSIPKNYIEVVHEDKKHNLWVVTIDERVGIFNTSYFTYKQIPFPNIDRRLLDGVKQLIEDNEGNIYVTIRGVEKPFYQYSEKTGSMVASPINDAIPKGWAFNEAHYDNITNRFWLATDSGLVLYDPIRKTSSYRGHNVAKDPVIDRLGNELAVTVAYIDQERYFWCVVNTGPFIPTVMHRFAPATKKYERYVPFNYVPSPDDMTNYREIKTIFSQKNGRIWVCGLAFLMEFKKEGTPIFDTIPVNDNCNPKSLSFIAASGIYEDRDHTLWMGSTNGVVRFTPDANIFSNYHLQRDALSPPQERTTESILERKNGELWFGTAGEGLFTLNKEFKAVPVKGNPAQTLSEKSVYSIHEHSKTGLIWMGYAFGKIAVYNPQTGVTDIWEPPFLRDRGVYNIAEDKEGNLWLVCNGMRSGELVKWDRKLAADDYKKGFMPIKKSDYTMPGVTVDNNNALWVPCYGEGLLKFNTTTNKQELRIKADFPDRIAGMYEEQYSDVVQYTDSTLVAVGNVISIINVRTNAVSTISRVHGLPGNMLSVEKDKDGILWCPTSEGKICRVNLERKIFTLYDKQDGLIDDIFVSGSSASLSDGRILMSTSRCVVAFAPADVVRSPSAPAAHITDFKLLNISLPVDSLQALQRIHLPYDQNSVTVEFSALTFASQNKVNYYYKMEGLDKDWIAADETQRAIYNYLPSGKYVFRIRTDNGASGNSAITALQITVHAVFYKTWWFWALIALAVASILWLLDRERVKRLVSLQKMRTEIAVNLHKDVTSTLNNINLLSEMARIKADKDLDRSKEYIQQISDKSNRMIVAMDDILWSIEPENDSMEKSLLRMREFIDALKNRYNAEIVLIADNHPGRVSMDMKKRHEFFLIFKEALRCVVQLAEGRDTMIHLDTSKNKLVLKIQDATANPYNQQQAVDEAARDIQNRSAQIKAETDIQYDQKGIAMIIQLPLTQ